MHKKIIILAALIILSGSYVFAQEQETPDGNKGNFQCRRGPETEKGIADLRSNTNPRAVPQKAKEEDLSELQRQSRLYRAQGIQAQNLGDMEQAMSFYQKALILDPGYAVVYNDLGVIYEGKGELEIAKDHYLKAVSIDPYFSSAYSNLALFYEHARDLDRAAYYWNKRIENGRPGDPWTERAIRRLEDIKLVTGTKVDVSKEEQVISLLDEINRQRKNYKKRQMTPAEVHFEKAKERYEKDDYATAIKEALDASQLDPANKQIDKFIDEVRSKALSQ